MKIFKYIWLLAVIGGTLMPACESTYLDKMEETDGFTSESVFGDSINFRDFVDNLILLPTVRRFVAGNSPLGDFDDITDNSISGPTFSGVPSVQAAAGDYYTLRTNGDALMSNNATWDRLWSKVRIANMGLNHIDMYPGSEATKNQIIGQCLYFRADSYLELVRRWGGMPYLYEPLDASAEMDLVRLGYQETLLKIAEDFAEAATYLPATVPPNEFQYPTSVAALGLKSRTLLYASSAFARMDAGSVDLWEAAALAADEAIRAAEDAGYELVPMSDYYYLFKEDREEIFMKEILFGRRYRHNWGSNSYQNRYRPAGQLSGNYGTQPNRRLVESFEMKETGLPVSDPESGYHPQDPYTGRDPRFYQSIIHNQQTVMGRVMEIYNRDMTRTPPTDGSPSLQYIGGNIVMGYTRTGYYNNKWMGQTFGAHLTLQWSDIRMAELYLNFAEAANEAWASPNTVHPSCRYTAEQAINIVRTRAQMPNIHSKFLNKNAFRDRIRNERRVELCFEDHRLFDIRRWRIAHLPEYRDIWGTFITKVPVSEEHPKGFMYEENFVMTRVFDERNYLFVIKLDDTRIGPNFVQNPGY
jgi:starch-binding outer membrane protein, SusD/RagB family